MKWVLLGAASAPIGFLIVVLVVAERFVRDLAHAFGGTDARY